jgi:lipopolysaccharide/colanic/teichoic acid biosynthesis glycosyltransferase
VTRLWQVNRRHDLAFTIFLNDYLHDDVFYVEAWSMTMDLYILVTTILALVTARGFSRLLLIGWVV